MDVNSYEVYHECEHCEASGEVVCKGCGGAGMTWTVTGGWVKHEFCKICQKDGVVTCWKCDGEGYVDGTEYYAGDEVLTPCAALSWWAD